MEKSFLCDQCDETFFTATALQRHRKSHKTPDDADTEKFPCTVADCSRVFSKEDLRFVHIKKFHEGKEELLKVFLGSE